MPTSANKDIVESKYSKYGENNMIIEGFVTDHEHTTDKTTATEGQSHAHTIPVSTENTDGTKHAEYMDCYPVDEKGNEVIELKSKPIPKFMKNNKIGIYAFWIFISFLLIFILYWIISSFIWNPLAKNSCGVSSQR